MSTISLNEVRKKKEAQRKLEQVGELLTELAKQNEGQQKLEENVKKNKDKQERLKQKRLKRAQEIANSIKNRKK